MRQRVRALARGEQVPVAVVVVSLSVVMYLLAVRGEYYSDDFLNATLAHDGGLSIHFLGLNIFNHFAPGFRLLDWATIRFLPFDYRVTLLVSIGVYALTLVAFHRLVRALVAPPRWWSAALVLLFGVSPLWLPSVMWWSAINALVASLCTVLAMDGYVRWRRGGRWWHLVECLGAMLVGLSFYEKPLLLLLFLPLLEVLLLQRGGWRSALRALFSAWPVWAGMAAIAALWLAAYVGGHYYLSGAAHPGIRSIARFVGVGWASGLVPGLLGGPLNWDFVFLGESLGRVGPPLWFSVVGQLVVLAGLAGAYLRRRALWWRGALFAAVCVAASLGLIGYARMTDFGIAAALDPRYLVDVTFIPLLAAAAVAFGGERAAPGVRSRRIATPMLAGGGLAAVVALAAVSATPAVQHWWSSTSANYIRTLRTMLSQLPPSPAFWDGTVPVIVMPPQFAPYNHFSSVVALYRRDARFDVQDEPMLGVRDDGSVAPMSFHAVATATLPGGPPPCVSPTLSIEKVGFTPQPATGLWFVQVDYDASGEADVEVTVGDEQAPPLHAAPGRHTYDAALLIPAAPAWARLAVTGGGQVCLRGMAIGVPQ